MAKKVVTVSRKDTPKSVIKRILKKNDELDNLILFVSMANIQAFYLKDSQSYPEIRAMFNSWFNESNRMVDAFDRFYFTQRKTERYEEYIYRLAAVTKKIMIAENFDELCSFVDIMAKVPKDQG